MMGEEMIFDVQKSATATSSGIDWGEISTNVIKTLGVGLSTVGLQALQQQVAGKVQQVKPAVEAAAARQAAPVAQAASWQKFLPYAAGGGLVLALAYVIMRRKGR